MPTCYHHAPTVKGWLPAPNWRTALLLAALLAALVAPAGAASPAPAVAAVDQPSSDAVATVNEAADQTLQLPEPQSEAAAVDPTVQFRRETPADEHRRRPGRNPAAEVQPSGQPRRAESSQAQEIAAIEAAAAAYRDAVTKGDVDAVAKFWTPDADYVDQEGRATPVKEKIKEARDKQRAGQKVGGRALADPAHKIRIITPGVAIEDGSFQHSKDADGQPVYGHYTAVWLKRDGHWLLDGVRESAVVEVTPASHLKALEWLVGDWQGKGSGLTADVSCVWGPDKNYLLRKIVLRGGPGDVDSTIQWIGWNPVQKQIRSFVFDSRGGFEDGVWAPDGDAWVVTAHGVLPDGRQTTFTVIHSRVDADHIICEIVEDQIDGEDVEDVRIDFKRKTKAAE